MQRPDFSAIIWLDREGGVYGAAATLVDTHETVQAPEGHESAHGCLDALLDRVFERVDAHAARVEAAKVVILPGDVP